VRGKVRVKIPPPPREVVAKMSERDVRKGGEVANETEEWCFQVEEKERRDMMRDHKEAGEVVDLVSLLHEGRELWVEVKDAHYDDFWRGWEPSPLRQRCRDFLKRFQRFYEALRERARKEGAKKPPAEGAYLVFGFSTDVDVLSDGESLFEGRTYKRYLSVSEEFAAMFKELQDLAKRVENKLDDYRFCE